MITQRMRMMAAAGFLVTMTPAWAGPAMQTGEAGQAKWRTYRSPEFGFRIDYPDTMTFYPGGPQRPPEKSMFPVCDDDTVACFEYNGHDFDRTQIQAMGVSVNMVRENRTAPECDRIETNSGPTRTKTINGVVFHFAETGDGGLGSYRNVVAYRVFSKHACFEVALVTAQSDLSAQDMQDAGLTPANPRTLRRLDAVMNRMMDSFAFVGPVKDGSRWSLFEDPGCGAEFEYPVGATVGNFTFPANFTFDSQGISCEQRFVFRGREYIVAAKLNLHDDDVADAWLQSAGFPSLKQMNRPARGHAFTEYQNAEYIYIYRPDTLYIFSVTDARLSPLSSRGDAVLAHLLRSFRVR
jgi:hypothetical protein